MARPNIRTINRIIAAVYPGYSLVQEREYVRVVGPTTAYWEASGFPVCRIAHQTPQQWVCDVGRAIQQQSTQSY